MKKKIVLVIVSALTTGILADDVKAPAKTDLTKKTLEIRVIDAFGVMQTSESGKDASKDLAETNRKVAEEMNHKVKDLEQDLLTYDNKKATMSESAREKEEKRLVKAKRDYEILVEDKKQEIQIAQAKASEKVIKEIRDAAEVVAKTESLDIIVDKTTGQILYSSAKSDVSDKVINTMNTKYAANKKATATAVADNKKTVPSSAVS